MPSPGPDAATLEHFDEVLAGLWQDNSPDEVLAQWRYQVGLRGTFPADALRTLTAVAADPPADLVDRMERFAWVSLTDEADPAEPTLPYADHVAWLRARVAELQAIFDAAAAPSD